MTEQSKNDDNAVALLYDITSALREGLSMEEQVAASLAEPIFAVLRRLWGGQEMYFPAEDKEIRNVAIRKAFNGRNRDEVCREFGISKPQFYRIIGRL